MQKKAKNIVKKPLGRPKKKLDRKLVNELIDDQLSIRAIAEITNIPKTTIQRSFGTKLRKRKSDAIKARVKKRIKLKDAQWDLAIKDKNPIMMIWLGKNELGQTDKIETTENKLSQLRIIEHTNGKT